MSNEDNEEPFADVDASDLLLLFIMRLKEIDAESKISGITTEKYQKCESTAQKILSYIEDEYGFDCVMDIIKISSKELGHAFGPIPKPMVVKLVKEGWVLDKKTKEVRPMNDLELINLFEKKMK